MTLGERVDRVLAELDREGLSSASAADAPRIRAIIAAAVRAAVAEEREQVMGWLQLAFTVIDRHVPIGQVPDGLDNAREFLARFRQGGADATHAPLAEGQEASLSDVSDDALLNELGLRLFAARLRFRGRNEQPGQVRLDLTADEVEELGRLTWSADVGVRDEGWQSDRREALGRKVRDAIAVVRGQQGGAGA
jgi:hypothetical protein